MLDILNLIEAHLQKALETNLAGTATEHTAGGMALNLYRELEEMDAFGVEEG